MEGFLFDGSRKAFAADFNFDLLVDPRKLRRDVGHANPDLESGGQRTARGLGNLPVALEDGVMGARRRASICHLEGHEAAFHTFLFLALECLATDELRPSAT